MNTSPERRRQPFAPLLWLALDTFDVGAEDFMIAPLLPDLAADFSVEVGTPGQSASGQLPL